MVMEGQQSDEARIILNALNHGVFAFNPDMMMRQMVSNYKEAEKLYGEGFIQAVASERDVRFPEVQRKLQKELRDRLERMQQSGFLNEEFEITEKGLLFAAWTLYVEELDHMEAKGLLGEKLHKERSHYGEKVSLRDFHRGDRYRDISLKRSIRQAIRHHHTTLEENDLQVFDRESKGRIHLIYGVDASGSMKGKKIEMCKKAGVALAFKAIEEHDKVGLIVFGSTVEKSIAPTDNFQELLLALTRVRAKKKTNIKGTILESMELFSSESMTKHLILITDAVPTEGDDPRAETMQAVEAARHAGITISVIGIQLDKEGEEIAREVAAIGGGKLYALQQLEELDRVVLMDYYSQ